MEKDTNLKNNKETDWTTPVFFLLKNLFLGIIYILKEIKENPFQSQINMERCFCSGCINNHYFNRNGCRTISYRCLFYLVSLGNLAVKTNAKTRFQNIAVVHAISHMITLWSQSVKDIMLSHKSSPGISLVFT